MDDQNNHHLHSGTCLSNDQICSTRPYQNHMVFVPGQQCHLLLWPSGQLTRERIHRTWVLHSDLEDYLKYDSFFIWCHLQRHAKEPQGLSYVVIPEVFCLSFSRIVSPGELGLN